MPFRLKNVGATYQRLVNRMLTDLICKKIKVYLGDMLVKSLKTIDHIKHIEITFKILKNNSVRINPLQCAFGVTYRKFLGYTVNQRDREANTEKIKALYDIKSPANLKKCKV